MTSGKYDRLLDDRPSGKIEDTIEGLIREIEKSEIKLVDLRILEMYYGGMDAEVIADELRLSVATVKEVIKAFEDGEYKTR